MCQRRSPTFRLAAMCRYVGADRNSARWCSAGQLIGAGRVRASLGEQARMTSAIPSAPRSRSASLGRRRARDHDAPSGRRGGASSGDPAGRSPPRS
jgi:hypothetical protein